MEMNLRDKLLWSIDWIRGSRLRRQLEDIQRVLALPYSEAAVCSKTRLSYLLSHARKSVPHYAGLNLSDKLSNWPVVSKLDIRENAEQFRSRLYTGTGLTKVVTSGSTGTPFQVFHDQQKRLRNSADTIYFARLAGFRTGDCLYYFKVWNQVNRKSKLLSFAQNIVPCDVVSLSDKHIARLLELLGRNNARKGFLGYASAYDAICSYCVRNGISEINANVRSIIAMSERLDPETQRRMESIFQCPAFSRYSNVENGIIAQQLFESSSEFAVNYASYWVEILKFDEDKNAGEGEVGRVVVTDLYNLSMPMIRYDTGDTGCLTFCVNTGKPRLSSIEGRRMDLVYDTQGHLVSSFTVTNQMWKYTEVKQYQFVQKTDRHYEFILNVDLPFSKEQELIDEFKCYFGQDALITVRYVTEVPLLASGKRKKVRSELAR